MHLVQTAMKEPARRDPAANPAPDEKALRAELAAAIEAHRAANGRVEIASDAERRASTELTEAQAAVQKLESAQEQASAAAVERHAKLIASAIRGGSPIPHGSPAMPADAASLTTARAQVAALRACLAELVAECDGTKQAASAAAAEVALKVDAVVMCTAQRLASEYAALVEMYTAFTDQLSGLQLFGRERQGRERFDELVAETLAQTDRRRQAKIADPRMTEDWKYQDLLTRHAKAGQDQWRAFAARLATDSGAQFEGARAPAEQ